MVMPVAHWRGTQRLTIFSSTVRNTQRRHGAQPVAAILSDEEKYVSRSYSLATVAFAVGAEPKWVDNLVA